MHSGPRESSTWEVGCCPHQTKEGKTKGMKIWVKGFPRFPTLEVGSGGANPYPGVSRALSLCLAHFALPPLSKKEPAFVSQRAYEELWEERLGGTWGRGDRRLFGGHSHWWSIRRCTAEGTAHAKTRGGSYDVIQERADQHARTWGSSCREAPGHPDWFEDSLGILAHGLLLMQGSGEPARGGDAGFRW